MARAKRRAFAGCLARPWRAFQLQTVLRGSWLLDPIAWRWCSSRAWAYPALIKMQDVCPKFRAKRGLLKGDDGVAAGLFIGLELEHVALLHFQQHVVEGAEAVGALVEAGVAAFDGLLDHGTVGEIIRTPFRRDGFQSFHDEVESIGDGGTRWKLGFTFGSLHFTVGSLCGNGGGLRGRASARSRRGTDQVVVIQEFVAVVDKEISGGILDADADDGLVVLAQLAYERREVGVAADDDEGVDVAFRVTQVERVHDHADVGGIFPRLAQVRDLDELECRLMQVALEDLVAVEVAIGFLAAA